MTGRMRGKMGRYYTCPTTGKKLPSVTTITGQMDKPALVYWAANCTADYIIERLHEDPNVDVLEHVEAARKNFRKVSAKAMDIGSAVHAAIEHWLKTGQEPQAPSDEVLSAFLAFLEWLDRWESWQTIKTEHSLYADRYAGTCDWIVTLDGKKFVIDFKTAKGVYPEYAWQIAGYRACDSTIEGCGILRLDKETGMPEWEDTSDTYEQDLKVFNCLTDLWYAIHKKEKL